MRIGGRIVHLGFAEVCGVDGLFERQKVARGDQLGVGFAAIERAGEIALVHVIAQGGKDADLLIVAFVAALGHFLRLVDAAVDHLEVGHDKLCVDDVDVAQRISRAFDVGDVAVVKAAHDMHDRVAAADIGQKLVAKTLALGRALDQTRDIDKFDDGGGELLGVVLVAQPLEPRIGDGDNADVGVDGTECVIVGGDAGVGNGVKECALADIRQAYDT